MSLKIKAIVNSFILPIMIIQPVFSENSEQIKYYIGESKMSSPEGISYGSSISLVKRTISPDQKKITEDVISADMKNPAKEFVTVFSINKNEFEIRDTNNTFSGNGFLVGDNWNWDQWKYNVNLADAQGVIKGEDKIVNGEIVVTKEFYQPKDKLKVRFNEVLKPVSKQFFEIMYSNLMNKK